MICEYENIEDAIRITFPRTVRKEDIVSLIEEINLVEDEYSPFPDRIVDFREVELFDFRADGMFQFARHRAEKKFPNRLKSALLIGNDYQLGVARMFQTLNTNPQMTVEIFTDERKAAAWIRSSRSLR